MIPKCFLRVSLSVCVAVLSFSGIAVTAQSTHVQPSPAPLKAASAPGYGNLPLSFEPNRGQADAPIEYLAHGSRYTVLLEPTAATLVLSRDDRAAQARHDSAQSSLSSRAAIRMALAGANPAATMSPERPLAGYVNYLTGGVGRSRTGIPTFAATRATSVYPGVDVTYYGTGRQLEYDFVVAPHSSAGQIHLSVSGAHPILQANGELRLELTGGRPAASLLLRKPVLYQEVDGARKLIDGGFTVAANGEIGFLPGAYDHTRELVIDPVISYASYFGGAAEDEINGSALNSKNELYAVGQTLSTSLPGTTGEFEVNPSNGNNGHDAFVTKFSADGTSVLWTTYLSGASEDLANGVAVNANDQAYVVGFTNSCPSGEKSNQSVGEFPFTTNAVQQLCNPNAVGFNTFETNAGGGYDAFLVQLSSDGKTELYGTPLGGSNDDFASGVALDASGKVYIVGETSSTGYLFAVSPNLRDVPSYPINNHQVASYGTANFPTTSSAFYTNITESVKNSTTDSNGNISGPTDEQAFLTVLSADMKTIVYSSLIGGGLIGGCGNGTCNTNGIAIAVNSAGVAYIGGNTSSAHWPTTPAAFADTCANAGAANSQCPMTGWLAAFDPTKSGAASLLFSTYVNGSSAGKDSNGNALLPTSDVFGLAVDSKGDVVATGDTDADNFPTTGGTVQPACVQFGDGNGNSARCVSAYLTKLSPSGTTVWSTYFGPTSQPGNGVSGQGVALDANDNVYVVGTSTSPKLPLADAISTNAAQSDDVFALELSPSASSVLMGTFIGSTGGISLNNNSLHLDSELNAYFSGSQCPNSYGGTSFPTTALAFDNGIQGCDGWVMKLITQQQTSTTALQITPNAGAPGTSITFTATVTGLANFSTPTGTVALTNGNTTLGTITLAVGTGKYTTSTLAAGVESIVATYSGDVVYATSAASPETVSIQNTPAISLTTTPSTANVGAAVALKASVSSSSGTPTGTVYFMDGTNALGSVVLSSGTATYSTTSLAVGAHSITAHYGGDNSFAAITSAAQTVTISAPAPSISAAFSPASLTITHGSTGTTTLTVTPANGFAGTLTLSCGALPSYASCGFAAPSLTFAAASSTAQTSVLTISTSASTTAALGPLPDSRHNAKRSASPAGTTTGAVFAALLVLPFAFTRRGRAALRRHSSLTLLACVCLFAVLGVISGCGGSGSTSTSTPPAPTPTTPAGSYTISVAIAGAPTATSLNLQVTVQ